MHKIVSLIITTYLVTAASASAIDVVMDKNCVLQVSGKLWNSSRSKYEANRQMLLSKGWTLTHDDTYLVFEQNGRKQFQLEYIGQGVKWEGNLQNAPICRSCNNGQTSFVNSKLMVPTQCVTHTSEPQDF